VVGEACLVGPTLDAVTEVAGGGAGFRPNESVSARAVATPASASSTRIRPVKIHHRDRTGGRTSGSGLVLSRNVVGVTAPSAPRPARSAARAIAAADGNRAEGSLASAVATSALAGGGTSGGSGGGSRLTCWAATATGLSPRKGGCPARQW